MICGKPSITYGGHEAITSTKGSKGDREENAVKESLYDYLIKISRLNPGLKFVPQASPSPFSFSNTIAAVAKIPLRECFFPSTTTTLGTYSPPSSSPPPSSLSGPEALAAAVKSMPMGQFLKILESNEVLRRAQALRPTPEATPPFEKTQHLDLRELGEEWLGKADMMNSVIWFTLSLQQDPKDADVYAMRGAVYLTLAKGLLQQPKAVADTYSLFLEEEGDEHISESMLKRGLRDTKRSTVLRPEGSVAKTYYNRVLSGIQGAGRRDVFRSYAGVLGGKAVNPELMCIKPVGKRLTDEQIKGALLQGLFPGPESVQQELSWLQSNLVFNVTRTFEM